MQTDDPLPIPDSSGRMSGTKQRLPSRQAIKQALTDLALLKRYHAIRVFDLIERSGVGRSTFYDHFKNKDEVLVEVAAPMLGHLANAACDRLSFPAAREMVQHLWAIRRSLRTMFDLRPRLRLQRELVLRIAFRLEASGKPAGTSVLLIEAIAAGQLAMIEALISGRTAVDFDAAARQFLDFSIKNMLYRGRPDPCPA